MMGYKYEVSSWIQKRASDFEYQQVYYGKWLVKAIFIMIREKIKGIRCVKFEWR